MPTGKKGFEKSSSRLMLDSIGSNSEDKVTPRGPPIISEDSNPLTLNETEVPREQQLITQGEI